MATEWFMRMIGPAITLLAAVTTILVLVLLYRIYRARGSGQLKKILVTVFVLFGAGYILYACGELTYTLPMTHDSYIPDMCWILGYMIEICAFAVLAIADYRSKDSLGKGLVEIMVTGAALTGLAALMTGLILGFETYGSFLDTLIIYAYPILSVLLLQMAVIVYLLFREVPQLSRALLFFALAAGSDVAGEFLFTYHDWNEIYGIAGASADICYGLAYVFAAAGFCMLIKRWATGDKKDVIKAG